MLSLFKKKIEIFLELFLRFYFFTKDNQHTMGNMLSMMQTTTQTQEKNDDQTQEKTYDQVSDDRVINAIQFIAENHVLGIELPTRHFPFQDFEIDDNGNMYCIYDGKRLAMKEVIHKQKNINYSVRPQIGRAHV